MARLGERQRVLSDVPTHVQVPAPRGIAKHMDDRTRDIDNPDQRNARPGVKRNLDFEVWRNEF